MPYQKYQGSAIVVRYIILEFQQKQIYVCSETLFPENANIRTRFTVETQTRGIKGCFRVADSMSSSEVRSKEKKF